MAQPCTAQDSYIEGVSEIAASPDGSQVYTWSETYLTPDLAFYYGAYVEGYLYQNGGLVDGWYADEYPYLNDAIVEMEDLTSVGSQYELFSNHAVWAYWIYYVGGTDYYYNPDALSFASGDVPGSTDYLPFESGPIYSYAELIYLGSTDAQLSAAPPSNLSLNPSGAAVETSGTITVTGSNLLDLCTGNTTVSITESGATLTLDPTSLTSTQATVDYTIAANASTGSQTLTLRTCFGSGSASFTVGDPTPVINQVNPNNWPAGAQTSFTITGSGFGTAPTLAVSGNGVTASGISSHSDTQINATVTIASNAPSGIATITVTSTGYLGNGFISTGGSGGSTNSATAKATIAASQGPAPTIRWGVDNAGNLCNGGTNIAGQTQNVVVGQQIAFTACFSIPQGATIVTESWSPPVPPGSVVAGYNASTAGGSIVPFQSTTCVASSYCDFPMFYWVDTGGNGTSFTFTYMYTLNGSSVTGSASLPFGVTAPTGATVNAPTTSVNIWAQTPPPPIMQLGSVIFTPGIQFTASASTPPGNSGQYMWVQLINSDAYPRVVSAGRELCIPDFFAADPSPELDNTYPYGSIGNYVSDSPFTYLAAETGDLGGLSRRFSATMYLTWIPTADTRCPIGPGLSACTIPVPLGTVSWKYCGDSINTLATQPANSTTWTLNGQSETPSPAPFQPSSPSTTNNYGYPTWKKTVQNGTIALKCNPY